VTGNQQFILALFLGLVAGIPPTVTAIVLYMKARADRELVVKAVAENARLAQESAKQTQSQLTEVHQIVNSRLDKALNSMKVLEDALRAAGIKIPSTPSTPSTP